MTHEPHQTRRTPRRPATPAAAGMARDDLKELMRAKMELVAARERGERETLVRLLTAHPAHAAALSDFSAALVATSGYEREELTPETERVAQRAFARAMANVFPAQAAPKPAAAAAVVAQGAAASLKALRRMRGLSQMDLARKLGLGPDVLSNLEAGLIRAASIPERFVHALGAALDATVDQVNRAIQIQAMALPALLRSSEGATKHTGEQPQQDFLDAVRFSPDMTAEQKARWLDD